MLLDAWNSLSISLWLVRTQNMKWFFVSVFAPNHVQCAETDIIIDWGNVDVNRSRYKESNTSEKKKMKFSSCVCTVHMETIWNILVGLLWFAHKHRQWSANQTWITVAATFWQCTQIIMFVDWLVVWLVHSVVLFIHPFIRRIHFAKRQKSNKHHRAQY